MAFTDDDITATASLSITEGAGGFVFSQFLPAAGKAFINGKLGIGTLNPQTTLDVNGTLRVGGDLTVQGTLLGNGIVPTASLRDGAVTLPKLATDVRGALTRKLNGILVTGTATFVAGLPTELSGKAALEAAAPIDEDPPPPFPQPVQPVVIAVADRDLRGKLLSIIGLVGSAPDSGPATLSVATNAKSWSVGSQAKQVFAYCKPTAPAETVLELIDFKVPEFSARFLLRFGSSYTYLEMRASAGKSFGYGFQFGWQE